MCFTNMSYTNWKQAMHVLRMAVVSWISSGISVLIGHVCQGINTLTCSQTSQKKKKYSPCNTSGVYNTQGTHFQGLKKKKKKITFQRNNKNKTSISHYLVSVKNRNPPVTFIQELCRLYTVCTLTLLIIHCLYVYEQFKKRKSRNQMHIIFQKDVLSNIFELKRENDTKSYECIAL